MALPSTAKGASTPPRQYANRAGWTQVALQLFHLIMCDINMSDDVLCSADGSAAFAERWNSLDVGNLLIAQASE